MNTKKTLPRLLSMLLCCVLLVGLLPTAALATQTQAEVIVNGGRLCHGKGLHSRRQSYCQDSGHFAVGI